MLKTTYSDLCYLVLIRIDDIIMMLNHYKEIIVTNNHRRCVKFSMIKNRKLCLVAAITAMMLCACARDTAKDADAVMSAENNMNDITYEGMISDAKAVNKKNSYQSLNVATYLTKVGEYYFIADCYHDQIIYHDNLSDPLSEWNVLTDEVHYAHTIASDGTMLLIDDTENNRLMVFQKTKEGYVHTQTLDHIGMKPHYVQYDDKKQVFMAWSSITGEMYMIKRAPQADENGIYPLYIENILKIDELYGIYVRSFTIMEDDIYFVSGHNNQKIIQAVINSSGDGFDIVAEYHVADEIAGMVQMSKIEDYYYITISTDNQENQEKATIIRTDSLEKLADGAYEDIYDQFGISGGTPYYITEIEGRYYMAHHRTSENIIAFDINDNRIENVAVIY